MRVTDMQKVLPLQKVPFAITVLKEGFIAEWEPWYGPGGQGEVVTLVIPLGKPGENAFAVGTFPPEQPWQIRRGAGRVAADDAAR